MIGSTVEVRVGPLWYPCLVHIHYGRRFAAVEPHTRRTFGPFRTDRHGAGWRWPVQEDGPEEGPRRIA